jgi:hypothetical protein
MFTTFWALERWEGRLSLLIVAVSLIRTLVRFVKLASCLYSHSNDSISTGSIVKGEISLDALAEYALSDRIPPALGSDRTVDTGHETNRDSAIRVLRFTRSKFLYLCGRCSGEIESAKRTGWCCFSSP